MKILVIGLIIVINLILQPTLFQFIRINNVLPNTSLILVVCFAINNNKTKGTAIGFTIGILQDILFSKMIGINALIYMLIGYFISLTNRNIFKDNLIIPVVLTGLATGFYYIVGTFLVYFLGFHMEFFNIFKNMLFVEIVYNAIISIFIYIYVSKLYKSKRKRY
ncbi:rod shape-determining protein MreD [Natronincola peptidivorans]|uniref:Rod shape-determining protein MreD n=1 Tax=Natronincola peptidivorans TaxID=426128 RepID=A0A1H9Z1Z4_9FIRM|nr:rod shape-determining protein MreD [Natronincola peptidivorans]SES74891.1 rod shape-determining protein MreD [Natronincola peptidivorans]